MPNLAIIAAHRTIEATGSADPGRSRATASKDRWPQGTSPETTHPRRKSQG
jgi:hypothetical protein